MKKSVHIYQLINLWAEVATLSEGYDSYDGEAIKSHEDTFLEMNCTENQTKKPNTVKSNPSTLRQMPLEP